MAGDCHQSSGQRTRRRLAAVIFSALLLSPVSIHAAVVVDTTAASFVSSCVWVQGNSLVLGDSDRRIPLYEVRAVHDDQLTPLERDLHADALQRFWRRVGWHMEQDDQAALGADVIAKREYVRRMIAAGRHASQLKAARRDVRVALQQRTKFLELQRDVWGDMILPRRPYTLLRDVKLLELSAEGRAVEHWLAFIKTGDPTSEAYALDHERQARAFSLRFDELVVELHSTAY